MDGNADRARSSRRATRKELALGTLVALGVAFGLGSCDTTADVITQTRNVGNVRSSGFIAPKGQCGNFGASGNVAKLRFVMIDDQDPAAAIRPGQELANGTVEMTNDSVTPQNSVAFEHPDLQCSVGGGTNNLEGPGTGYPQSGDAGDAGDMADTGGNGNGNGVSDDRVLNYDGTCKLNGFSCSLAGEATESAQRRCNRTTPTSVEQGQESVRFLSDTSQDQLFGVVVENSRGVGGYRPAQIERYQYDNDGDGTPETLVQSFADGLRTDPSDNRTAALDTMISKWKNVEDEASTKQRDTYLGLWEIQGDPGGRSVVAGVTDDSSVWTSDPEIAQDAADAFPRQVQNKGRGNVIQTMLEVLRGPYTDSDYSDAEKTLVVFADGPPAEPVASKPYSVQDVIDAANAENVRIFIVQLDTAIEYQEIYDYPSYWQVQSGNCSSDDECKNFETCREPRPYETTGGIKIPRPSDAGSYCMPEYQIVDDDATPVRARIGPVEDYGKIACATGGGFMYRKVPDRDLTPALRWLPYTMDGLWEADISVGAYSSEQNYTPGEPNRLQSTVQLDIGDEDRNLDLTQVGGEFTSDKPDSGDRRSVLFAADPNN